MKRLRTLLQLVHLEMAVDRSIEAPVDKVRQPADAACCLVPFIARRAAEASVVLGLSTKHHPMAVGLIGMGRIDEAPLSVAQVLRFALVSNAKALVLAHNHPSGDTAATEDDWAVTERVVAAAAFLEIDLLDHLIVVADGSFCSLRAMDQNRFLAPLGRHADLGGVADSAPSYRIP